MFRHHTEAGWLEKLVVWGGLLVGCVLGLAWMVRWECQMRADAYNRVTGASVTWKEVFWLDLRVQAQPVSVEAKKGGE